MKNPVEFRSICPVATSLDLIGDKWTLLILRDMIWGHKSLFNEFQQSPESIPSKMLANRLKKLEELGFVSKIKGSFNKKSIYYLLEKKGLDTFPIMVEMAVFSSKHFFDHLGTTYTKEARTTMKKDRKGYITNLITNYKKFKKNLVI
ncbi:MAG: transcriptional regulator [Chitinophagia bacterium]|jgi:DNA-binding HxlR family transcriptional regulator|nr:transcriptional regulator [Chitinophagia bacterium]NCA29580.1 transcriptional regulator [Chitinophagia bacterium]